MDVKNFQNEIFNFVSAWDKKRDVAPSEQATFVHLVEEVGELAREYVNQESRKSKFNGEELNNAIHPNCYATSDDADTLRKMRGAFCVTGRASRVVPLVRAAHIA